MAPLAVFEIRDGKIRAVREYMDTLYARDTAFGIEERHRGVPLSSWERNHERGVMRALAR